MNKTISIEPLARVEGHGGIEVVIKNRKVREVRVQIFEGPRLMEQITRGKTPDEAVSITSRICAICFASHRLADIRAHEDAMKIRPEEKTRLLRKLCHYGEIIESNALHYYLLAMPDYLGFPDAVTMMGKYRGLVKGGLELKKFGNAIMECVAGRRVHGENMRIGGFGRVPAREDLNRLKNTARELIPAIGEGLDAWPGIEIPEYCERDTVFMSVAPTDSEYSFASDRIMVSDGVEFAAGKYPAHIQERVVPHSYAKHCRYRENSYTVGALARMINSGQLLTGTAGDYFSRYYNDRWKKNPHFNNIAQAIEILFCLETIPSLVDRILAVDEKETAPGKDSGEGTGVVEAPRGMLIHHYELDQGKVKTADFVIPTNQNLYDMERYLEVTAQNLLDAGQLPLELPLEMVVRAYDPCISCSVHMVRIRNL